MAAPLPLRFTDSDTAFSLDLSRLGCDRAALLALEASMARAMAEMAELEKGALANADEKRMVGHYWLRAPDLAPQGIGPQIERTQARILDFAARVLAGQAFPPRGGRYEHLCLIGIGGSALGPQLLADALAEAGRGLAFACLDNTDPDGMQRLLGRLPLARTLFVVISKSGGTKETRNGQTEAAAACARQGLSFARQAVAVTGADSELDRQARLEAWIEVFPMWDWVGGRTSITSAVGLLPAALCGIDVGGFLEGARAMDQSTRRPDLFTNLAALLAAAWHVATRGRGEKDMVVLPYRDRLLLFSRYLQQLVMESLGKELDRKGRAVHQGIAVYGNKGSTDQHAYVQQLRDGVDNFFVTFVRVLEDGAEHTVEVEPGVTSADYLQGFWLGTRQALSDRKRANLTLTLPRLDAFGLGALIALFERAVGLYASLVDVNAYHQPGVEAGKKAATAALALRARLLAALDATPRTPAQLAERLGAEEETCALLLEHLAANGRRTGVAARAGGFARQAE